jgi:endonuclease YncB( thermonuclease family)
LSRRAAGYVGALLGAMAAIDGDTVRVDGNGSASLGLDTPETYHVRCHADGT